MKAQKRDLEQWKEKHIWKVKNPFYTKIFLQRSFIKYFYPSLNTCKVVLISSQDLTCVTAIHHDKAVTERQRLLFSLFLRQSHPELSDLGTEVSRYSNLCDRYFKQKWDRMKNYTLLIRCSITKIWRVYLLPTLKMQNRTQGIVYHLNHSMLEVGQDIWSPMSLLKAGATTASCSGFCPVRFCASLKMWIPQLFRAACSSIQSPSQ